MSDSEILYDYKHGAPIKSIVGNYQRSMKYRGNATAKECRAYVYEVILNYVLYVEVF